MNLDKNAILNLLHSNGQHDQADQAAQTLPDQVDTEQHAGLLSKLGLNIPDLIAKFGGGGGGLGSMLGGLGGGAAGGGIGGLLGGLGGGQHDTTQPGTEGTGPAPTGAVDEEGKGTGAERPGEGGLGGLLGRL